MIEPLLEDEMIDRLNIGENPIDLSIEKYERLLLIAESGGKIDEWWVMSDCCPLCHEFYCNVDEDDEDFPEDYIQCPLELYDDSCCNSYSSWDNVSMAIRINNNEMIITSIKKMIEKLKWIKEQMVDGD